MRRFCFLRSLSLFLTLCALLTPLRTNADVRLPQVLSDRAVLQRDLPIPIWGWAEPGETVTVTLGDNPPAVTTGDAAGRWRVDLPPQKAGGPHKLTVAGKNTLTVADLLVGEVWICVGQSNMQLKLAQTQNAKQDIPLAADPLLRLAFGLGPPNTFPQTDVSLSWAASTPGSAQNFSAVAYYFGKQLREKLGVPVGIIHSSAGAIPIEAWTPAAGCQLVPSQHKIIRLVDQVRGDFRKLRETALTAWIEKARAAAAAELPLPPLPAVSDAIVQRGWMQTTLYNSTIHPLIPYGIRGAVLYQGEANNGQGMEYFEKLQAFVGGWRKAWGQGDFPVLFVQLAPWAKYSEGNLEGIWEAQRAALTIPNTGMAVTTDLVPDLNDIHPPRKLEIGNRLALWALAKTYGRDNLVYSGPLFKSAKIEGDKIRIQFEHVGSGLATRNDQPLDNFQIGTPDGFYDAEAKIEGDSVVVRSDQVSHPAYVRFGWKNTAQPNLINKEGLPASPFRTDCGPVKFSTGSRFANFQRVRLSPDFFQGVIRYTLDGSTPNEQSALYSEPLDLRQTTTVCARLFAADGRSSLSARRTYTKVDPVNVAGKTLVPGLDFEYYIGRWTTLPDYDALKADRGGVIDTLEPPSFSESFMSAHRLRGYLEIPTAGEYVFTIKCHGGARMYLNENLAVDDEGFHAPVDKAGERLALSAGKHPLTILYHEGGGSPLFSLQYEGPGIAKQPVPNAAFFRHEQTPSPNP